MLNNNAMDFHSIIAKILTKIFGNFCINTNNIELGISRKCDLLSWLFIFDLLFHKHSILQQILDILEVNPAVLHGIYSTRKKTNVKQIKHFSRLLHLLFANIHNKNWFLSQFLVEIKQHFWQNALNISKPI